MRGDQQGWCRVCEKVHIQEMRFMAQQRPAQIASRFSVQRATAAGWTAEDTWQQTRAGEACPQTLCQPRPQEGRAAVKASPHLLEALGGSACPGRYSQCLGGSGVSHIKRATPQSSHTWWHGNCAAEGSLRQCADCKRVCATLGLSPMT